MMTNGKNSPAAAQPGFELDLAARPGNRHNRIVTASEGSNDS